MWKATVLATCSVIGAYFLSQTNPPMLLLLGWLVYMSRNIRTQMRIFLDDPTDTDDPYWNDFERLTSVSIMLAVVLIGLNGLQNLEDSHTRTTPTPAHSHNRATTRTDTTVRDFVQLPQSLNEFYYEMKSQNFLTLISHPGKWPPKMQKLVKYSAPALVYGRPLNKVMVVMIGQTGTGKSTTINNLFADNVCATSADTSETHEVTEYGKDLNVTSESPAVKAVLSFVDLPGALDVDHTKEAQNLASVKKFRVESSDLVARKGIELPKTLVDITIREAVYPNMILMAVKATDNRMVGPDSNLQKSLKMLDECQMLDKHFVNLILVVTHAMSIPYKKYKEQSYKITSNLRDAVYNVLRIRDIDVVFVENMPEYYDMVKVEGSDFYSLPDGQLSHYNLIRAMEGKFKDNHDFLGRLLTGWYFAETCPEKKNQVNILNSVSHKALSFSEIREAQQTLFSLGVQATTDHEAFPVLQFHVLGRGFCPRAESLRHISVFRETETKQVDIYGRKYTVPKNVHVIEKSETHCQHLSWDTRETYENQKRSSYGLDNDILLVVNVDSRGRWVKDNNVAQSKASLVSFLYETRLINARMDDMERQVREDLIDVIEELPDWYDSHDIREFHAFFSKWGTHFVCEVWIGGSIKIDTSIHRSQFSEEIGSEISGKLRAVFSLLAENRETDTRSFAAADVRMQDEILTITGGDPPQITTLKDLTPQKFSDWVQSIKRSPSELLYSVKLYPYYNLVKGRHHFSLKDATFDYLAGLMPPESKLKRENVAKRIVEEVKNEKPTGSSCFPATANVYTATGVTAVNELKYGEKIQTLPYNRVNSDSVTMTEFYTYLHFDRYASAKFLEITLHNKKVFSISEDHLVFVYKDDNVAAIPAKQLTRGQKLVFIDVLTNAVGPAEVVYVHMTWSYGVYAPLTHEGTLIVDGVLVSCYASVDSHAIAHFSMAPLRLWYNTLFALNALNSVLQSLVSTIGTNLGLSLDQCQHQPEKGIHLYARLLMFLRNVIFC